MNCTNQGSIQHGTAQGNLNLFDSLANVVDLFDVGRYYVLGLLQERVHDGGAVGQFARDARNTCNNRQTTS